MEVRTRWPWEPPEPPAGEPGPDLEPELAPWLAEKLFARRIVFLRGTLTHHTASTAAASLLSLDLAEDLNGDPADPDVEPVQLHLAAPDGELEAALSLMDVIDGLRVPVRAVATAEVGGAAVGVYAVAGHRVAYPHARFRLGEPRVSDLAGTADDIAAAAGRHLRALEDLVVRVAEATGRPRSRVEDDFGTGLLLDAAQAQEYGLVHEVRRPHR